MPVYVADVMCDLMGHGKPQLALLMSAEKVVINDDRTVREYDVCLDSVSPYLQRINAVCQKSVFVRIIFRKAFIVDLQPEGLSQSEAKDLSPEE